MATLQNMAVLTGYDPEAPQPHLRFGDIISLIPNHVNGIVTFAGAADARPWVEKIQRGVQTPPNLRDCQFKLLPRRQYAEDKALKKLVRRRSWDGGKNLPLPPVPREDANINSLVEEFARKHNIEIRPSLKEVFQRMIAAAEEMKSNISEEARQMKSTIHYGDALQLQHVATRTMPTISKQQARERGSKKVEMVEGGEEDSVFEVAPAFKTFGTGEPVSSGDLIVLKTKKRMGGLHYYLRMSHLPELKGTAWRSVMRQLQLENDAVVGVEEVNAATEHVQPTPFRPLLFAPLENTTQYKNVFKAEEVVCLYHKEAEAYLDYNPVQSSRPIFRASKRVAYKARKKSSWMWKIESTCTVNAAGLVNCSDTAHYRIKHVVTNLYLMQHESHLEMTADYTDNATLFSFRTFSKEGHNHAQLQSLVYIRSRAGFWLTQDESRMAVAPGEKGGADHGKAKGLLMSQQEFASERDALLLLPPLPSSVTAVVQMGRVVRRLRNFASLLESVPKEETDAGLADMMVPREERQLSTSARQVLALTEEVCEGVIEKLKTLLLNITYDDDSNPMSRDGVPNRLLQKLLREMHAISIIMRVVQLPFERGIGLHWMEIEGNKPSLFDEEREHSMFTNLLRIISMCYRLLKQMVKQDRRNAEELHDHVDVIRSHLGMGLSCEATLKEMYDGKRPLLSKVGEDLISQIVDLLGARKDPRYLDILLSLCQCDGEPMAHNQALIGRLLLEKNAHLLPTCQISRDQDRAVLKFHVHGASDPITMHDVWIDLSKYAEAHVGSRVARVGDVADQILTEEFSSLDEEEKLVRYFIRCTNLFSKLVLGRNQRSLALLLNNEHLCLKYEDILTVMQEASLPALVRARYSTMMMNFYVDRDPQASKPQILYTRPWSHVQAAEPEGELPSTSKSGAGAVAPTCTTGFQDLMPLLLQELGRAGTRLRRSPTFGQLELARAQVELTDLLLDFGFFLRNANTVEADFNDIITITEAIFSLLGTDSLPTPSKTREGVMHSYVRSISLGLLLRTWNLRADYRLSCSIACWEDLFDKLQVKDPEMKKLQLSKTGRPLQRATTLRAMTIRDGYRKQELFEVFKEYDGVFEELAKTLFARDIVSSPSIGSDRYDYLGHEKGDTTVDTLLALLGYRDIKLSQDVCSLLFRHISQRTRIASDLQEVQLLVFPTAVRVYRETQQAIAELTSLKKLVSKSDSQAVGTAKALLQRMTGYLRPSASNPAQVVQKNQRIMLNLELDEPIVDLLRLDLERDTTRRDKGELEADAPRDALRRDLFQCCYDYLRALTVNFDRAQQKLFPLITFFCDHMGVEELNVSETLGCIVKDNPAICQQVSENFLRQFTNAIKIWGRKNRWLATLKVFLEVNGKPFKRNQDLILRCLMDDSEILLDLTCDYSDPLFLPKTDERFGKTRTELLNAGDHLRKVRSLVKYHVTSLDILAMCAAGKNAVNQEKIFELLEFRSIVNNILDLERRPDGTWDKVEDADALHFVQTAWVRLMRNVYITSFDSGAVKKVQTCRRFWGERGFAMREQQNQRRLSFASAAGSRESNADESAGRPGLLEEFASSLALLRKRLDSLKQGQGSWCDSGEWLEERVADEWGQDVGSHVRYVDEVLETLIAFFGRTEFGEQLKDVEVREVGEVSDERIPWTTKLVKELPQLAMALREKGLLQSVERVGSLITEMSLRGVNVKFDASSLAVQSAEEEGESKEARFQVGWVRFLERLTAGLGVSLTPGKSMDTGVKELAVLFSARRRHNEELQGLKELMRLLCSKECDSFVRLNGLKVLRAILYIGDRVGSEREAEYERMLDNEPPADAVNDPIKFRRLQVEMAQLGATDVVVSCLPLDDPEIVMATLCLAVALLEGGNPKVQAMFEATLSPASSQGFFLALQRLFTEAVQGIKEEKKQAKAMEAALAGRGAATIRQAKARSLAESPHGQVYMAEVMKMMRRMFMGQNRKMQNILRQQRLNRISIDCFDLAINYLTAIEPELKRAIAEDNADLVEGAIRGFLMLSESMRGPNYANQTAIANTGIFDLGDRIFFKIRFEDCDGSVSGGEKSRRLLRRGVPVEREELALERRRNTLRGRLKQALLTCLQQFLEGVQEEAIPQHMLLTCQWSTITQQIVQCVTLLQGERSDIVDLAAVREEALGYYFLLRLLRTFDKADAVIAPAMAAAPQAMAYLEVRTGYVEIFRNERLERIYYALPQDCINGGALDRSFEDMYDTERGDPDRKNQGWLHNMRKIVEREEFNERVRKSYLGFTVLLAGTIDAIALAWVFILHMVLICGGYAPVSFRATQREFVLDGGADGENEERFIDVLPTVVGTARVLCWVFLGICLLRTFTFCCLHLPSILERGREGDSDDAREGKSSGGGAEERDVEAEEEAEEVLLVEAEEREREGDVTGSRLSAELHRSKTFGFMGKEQSGGEEVLDLEEERPPSRWRERARKVATVAGAGWVWYELFFLLFAVLAVVLDEPLYTSFALLEICFWRGSKTVIDAIYFNATKMLQTMLLGLLVLYLWMVVGMGVLREQLQEGLCVNIFQCFVSSLTLATRDLGVFHLLTEESFPTNIVDALVGDQALVLRLVWDLLYQVLFLYILVAIITGVVIDAFGGLRDERDSAERDLKQYCFVCNLDRFHLDQHGLGFDKHIRMEHNPRWYLFFLFSIKQKPVLEHTGQERYVMSQVWPVHGRVAYRWLPRDTTFSVKRLDDKQADQPIKELEQRLARLEETVEDKVESLSAALERNTSSLDAALAALHALLPAVSVTRELPPASERRESTTSVAPQSRGLVT